MLLAERTCPAVCDGLSGHIGIGLHSAGLMKGFSRRLCNFKILRMCMIFLRIITTTSVVCSTMFIALKTAASNTTNAVHIAALLILHKKVETE